MFVEERGVPIYVQNASFQEKEMIIFNKNFVSVYVLEILFPTLNKGKNG